MSPIQCIFLVLVVFHHFSGSYRAHIFWFHCTNNFVHFNSFFFGCSLAWITARLSKAIRSTKKNIHSKATSTNCKVHGGSPLFRIHFFCSRKCKANQKKNDEILIYFFLIFEEREKKLLWMWSFFRRPKNCVKCFLCTSLRILPHAFYNIYMCTCIWHVYYLGDRITAHKKNTQQTKIQVTLFAMDKNKNALYLSKRWLEHLRWDSYRIQRIQNIKSQFISLIKCQ